MQHLIAIQPKKESVLSIDTILHQWIRLEELDGVSTVKLSKNTGAYSHEFTHVIWITFKNNFTIEQLRSEPLYIELAHTLNTSITKVLLMDLEDITLPIRNSTTSEVPARKDIHVGQTVWAVEKKNYSSGKLTEGIVKRILTSKPYHPRGTKVMFEDGTVARVQSITPPDQSA